MLWLASKTEHRIHAFDGLAVLPAAAAVPCIYVLCLPCFSKYEEGNNAMLSTRIVVESVMLVSQPLLYLLANKLTKVEIKRTLNHQKWIAVVALALSLFTGLVVLIIGIGLMMVPYLSGLTS